mmetsp:Transcript_95581/g.270257  ORF Transcript_95581/g.270257 Transcript_95581/m.270257 type:complete len:295 (-) Transcript_95581:30-914(-)
MPLSMIAPQPCWQPTTWLPSSSSMAKSLMTMLHVSSPKDAIFVTPVLLSRVSSFQITHAGAFWKRPKQREKVLTPKFCSMGIAIRDSSRSSWNRRLCSAMWPGTGLPRALYWSSMRLTCARFDLATASTAVGGPRPIMAFQLAVLSAGIWQSVASHIPCSWTRSCQRPTRSLPSLAWQEPPGYVRLLSRRPLSQNLLLCSSYVAARQELQPWLNTVRPVENVSTNALTVWPPTVRSTRYSTSLSLVIRSLNFCSSLSLSVRNAAAPTHIRRARRPATRPRGTITVPRAAPITGT